MAAEQPFGCRERAGHPRAEIAFQNMTVIRVDDARRSAPSRCGVVYQRRGATDGAGLRHVRVHDGRAEPPQQRSDARQRHQVGEWSNVAPQRRHEGGLEPAPGGDPGAHVAFAGAEPPVDEQRVIATLLEMRAEIDGLNRGPAHVQPRDDAHDSNRNGDVVGRRHGHGTVLPPLRRSTASNRGDTRRRVPGVVDCGKEASLQTGERRGGPARSGRTGLARLWAQGSGLSAEEPRTLSDAPKAKSQKPKACFIILPGS